LVGEKRKRRVARGAKVGKVSKPAKEDASVLVVV
jgi:hypothetical protein